MRLPIPVTALVSVSFFALSSLAFNVHAEVDVQRVADLVSGRPSVPGEEASGLFAYYRTGHHHLGAKGQRLIRDFAAAHLTDAFQASETVYYPFGGPDVIFPTVFFPKMKTLILVAAENVGELPNGSGGHLAAVRDDVKRVVRQVLDLTFYRTDDMRTQQADARLATLTKIVASLAVLDATLDSLEEITLDSSGNVVPFTRGNGKERTPGVRIRYTLPHSDEEKTVYYFQQNLGGYAWSGLPALKNSPGFMRFIERLPSFTSYLKAASYLSHEGHFALSNELALRADYVVQTDTGIPYRFFKKDGWDLTLFGGFRRPIGLFRADQPDLLTAIRKGGTLEEGGIRLGPKLPFRYDYGSPDVYNIMYAVKVRKALTNP